jgi:hypothetical protein
MPHDMRKPAVARFSIHVLCRTRTGYAFFIVLGGGNGGVFAVTVRTK